ncbi:MAG: fused MFS/spermidine synthase [Acidobacteriia bacterium]|nr:fused MFS/spermidine synthase [Terriglobia bacterium]
MPLYALTIFLSAFLLFQIQPIIAKTILPWFGGSAAVWTTCMLFFQMELLLGYGYAHFSIKRLRPRTQAIVHGALLLTSLALLPVLPGADWKPTGSENPTLHILALLGATVGLPYLLLSTTGPLVQAWYARSEKAAAPYRLFALSNLGSMLALVSYPPLVEPFLSTRAQAYIWSGAFAVFAIFCTITAFRSARFPAIEEQPSHGQEDDQPPSLWDKLMWVGLAACPSILMLAVTNHLTQDVSSIPFLWILPLSLYLLSFILSFDTRPWYVRNLFLGLLAPALGGMGYMQWSESKGLDMKLTIALFAVSFFVASMVCHGELSLRKPAPLHLTGFYLMLSIGGALGGLFVGVVAPYLFISNFELPLGIALCAILGFLVAVEEPGIKLPHALVSVSSLALFAGVFGLCLFLGRTMKDAVSGYRLVQRNFYGTLRVREDGQTDSFDAYRSLLHGSINHGEQWTHPDRRREALTYYCPETGIGRSIRLRKPGAPQKVGIIGLGAGTMASFGRAGDEYRFYEINPLVPRLARTEFTYLPDCRARLDVVMGDGRLSLEREPSQAFDVLMMDAFSGDSIPTHLITREAFDLYFRHLKPSGVIAVHISNKYLDLEPVIASVAREMGKAALVVETDEDESGSCFGTTYVLVASDGSVFQRPSFIGAGRKAKINIRVSTWTDNYSNLFRILK